VKAKQYVLYVQLYSVYTGVIIHATGTVPRHALYHVILPWPLRDRVPGAASMTRDARLLPSIPRLISRNGVVAYVTSRAHLEAVMAARPRQVKWVY
jgi:hypothetical protein